MGDQGEVNKLAGGDNSSPPEARIVSDKPLTAKVAIQYPVEFDGKTWTEIPLRRCTGREVQDYMKGISSNQELVPPGVECPIEVWQGMVDDDLYVVEGVYGDSFFPQRLRDMAEQMPETTEDSSD